MAFNLLMLCLRVYKVKYMFLVARVECRMDDGKLYDTLVEETLLTMVGSILDTTVFKDLQLPTIQKSAEVPAVALGLRFAVTIAPSAVLASAV